MFMSCFSRLITFARRGRERIILICSVEVRVWQKNKNELGFFSWFGGILRVQEQLLPHEARRHARLMATCTSFKCPAFSVARFASSDCSGCWGRIDVVPQEPTLCGVSVSFSSALTATRGSAGTARSGTFHITAAIWESTAASLDLKAGPPAPLSDCSSRSRSNKPHGFSVLRRPRTTQLPPFARERRSFSSAVGKTTGGLL